MSTSSKTSETKAEKAETSSSQAAQSHSAPANSSRLEHPLLFLQRAIGNQAVLRLVRSGGPEQALQRLGLSPISSPASRDVIQPKLAINRPGDEYEQEADRVADQVMRTPEPHIQRQCASGGTPTESGQQPAEQNSNPVQMQHIGPAVPAQTEAPGSVHDTLRSPGQPLDSATRASMEPRFGHDFSQVRVHTDAAAAQSAQDINARAYTSGHNIAFASGQYSPGTAAGNRLIAHELTHVVQQSADANVLRRAPKEASPAQKMTDAEAEESFRDMGGNEAFSDPSGPLEGPFTAEEIEAANEEIKAAIEESLQQSLTPEEMHRQLLVRRAQPLGASAYQAADPEAARTYIESRITAIKKDIEARKEKIAELKKQGSSTLGKVRTERAQIAALEKDARALKKAQLRLAKTTRFSRFGKGAPAGTGRITYAAIQIESATGRRISIEFAETVSKTEHAEEAIIERFKDAIEKGDLKPGQLIGARVTVVGDQFVCAERCIPALTKFAEDYKIESIDSVVYQRTEILPPGFEGPPNLASPRSTLRTMTKSSSEGMELIERRIAIYRRSVPPSPGATAAETAVKVDEAVAKAKTTVKAETAAPETAVKGALPEVKVGVMPSLDEAAIKLAVTEIALNVLLFAVGYYFEKRHAEKEEQEFKDDLTVLWPEINTRVKNKEAEALQKKKEFPLVYANITVAYMHEFYSPEDYDKGSMSVQDVTVSHQNYRTPEKLIKRQDVSSGTGSLHSLTFSVPLFEETAAEKGAGSNYRQVREKLIDPAYKVRLDSAIRLAILVKQDPSLQTLVVRDFLGLLRDEEPLVRKLAAETLINLRATIAAQYIADQYLRDVNLLTK